MPTWKYAPVPTDEGVQMGGSRPPSRRVSVIDPEQGQVQGDPSTYRSGGGGHGGDDEDSDDMMTKRMPYCLGMLVLLAIVYVLSRTETTSQRIQVQQKVGGAATFDIGAYRRERLGQTPPHIIECVEAGEGGSQEACHLPRNKRYQALGQKGATLWMTGLSGSGKSTIATALEEELVLRHGKHVYRLDGDNIRTGLNRDLSFTDDDRAESVRRVGELACLFSDSGTVTIVSLVSPFRDDRDAVRKRHEEQGIPFFEVFMDVSLDVVRERDPKGLYKQVDAGKIKGFTGVDSPYEPPLAAEIRLPNQEMTIDECVNALLRSLKTAGILSAGAIDAAGLPMPDGDEVVDLHVPPSMRAKRMNEALTLPMAPLTDMDLNWLQTVGEGWASPLKGFMREGTLLQTIHFASYLGDPHNVTGNAGFNERATDFGHMPSSRPPIRISSSIPITLAISGYTKGLIEVSKATAVTLTTKDGTPVAILRDPEIYANRKEEIVARVFGVIDPGHPYIANINDGGDWLLGGEIELLDRIRYNDGLDKWRLTAREVRDEFAKKGADVIYAFQTRNPTHAGHAYLMKSAGDALKKQGYKRPVLWLSPLGGWTKSDDVPLDVRVRQHEEVLRAGQLDPDSTVMAIWPAPMVYAGPTEVQFHAKSRRAGGASYFVVGRDPAGMKGSELAGASPDDDLYDPEHGRYVLAMSPGVGGMKMLDFPQVYYDKKTHTMTEKDMTRPDDFISISGTKMRALAAQGAKPCPMEIPGDLLAANCIPPGFMVPGGWDIVCDYYQHINDKQWVAFSRPATAPQPVTDVHTSLAQGSGEFGTPTFELYLRDKSSGAAISPWHDVPLMASSDGLYNMVVEIPAGSTAKMEVQKQKGGNPIMQDESKGLPRYYTYGVPFFSYGLLPQTWEDPASGLAGTIGGDNDPLDVMEIGEGPPLAMGAVVPVKVLGSLELIDEGETDHKILVIRANDPLASRVQNMQDIETLRPGTIEKLVDWLVNYKTTDGKPVNSLAKLVPNGPEEAVKIIDDMHARWKELNTNESAVVHDADFCLTGSKLAACKYPQ